MVDGKNGGNGVAQYLVVLGDLAGDDKNGLHPAEQALIGYIRELGYGEITIKVLHGLPEIGYNILQTVKFNKKGGV